MELRVEGREEWSRVAQTGAFRELMSRKKAFTVPAMVFVAVFFFTLPVLTAFTTVLNAKAVGAITWAYVYGFAQFPMTWILAHLYANRANKWDKLVERARQEAFEAEVK